MDASHVTSQEFLMGFTNLALQKPFQMEGNGKHNATRMDVLEEIVRIVKALVMDQMVQKTMKEKGASGW